MREILFRGKSMSDGEWVQGSLVITTIEPANDAPFKHYHIEDMTIGVFPNEFQSGLSETVIPSTVGQYTGLTDKNGKKIFEGDVVRLWCGTHGTFELCVSDIRNGLMPVGAENIKEIEIIGNIHDNPELTEGWA